MARKILEEDPVKAMLERGTQPLDPSQARRNRGAADA
jgi:hypothetical protein